MERNVLEVCPLWSFLTMVDHLYEHFRWSCTINEKGRYNAPNISEAGYRGGHVLSSPIVMLAITVLISIEMKPESIAGFEFLTGHIGRRRKGKEIDL